MALSLSNSISCISFNLYNNLKNKNIKYKENLILCEIFINKKDQLHIKKLVNEYVLDSIKAFYGKKLKYSSSVIHKYKKYILNLPNIKPKLFLFSLRILLTL